nr:MULTISPECIES: cation-transporting P-type ATPase [unclassified Cupriavidus]
MGRDAPGHRCPRVPRVGPRRAYRARRHCVRPAECGPNRIAAPTAPHWLVSLVRRLLSPVNVMLILLAFLSLLSQTLIVHIIRTRQLPFIKSLPSQTLLVTTIAVCIVGAWLPYSPLATALGMQPLPWAYRPLLGVILLGYAAAAFAARHLLARWIPVD